MNRTHRLCPTTTGSTPSKSHNKYRAPVRRLIGESVEFPRLIYSKERPCNGTHSLCLIKLKNQRITSADLDEKKILTKNIILLPRIEFNIFADKSSQFQNHWVINQSDPDSTLSFLFNCVAFYENEIVLQSGFANKINDMQFLVWAEGNGGKQRSAWRGQESDTSSYHLYWLR